MKRLLCLAAVFVVAGSLAGCEGPSADEGDAAEVYVARIDGEIDERTAQYVGRVLSEAGSANALGVAIILDTPGGSLDSTQQIVEEITNAGEVPVITYVSPQGARAASAGTFILMGSDVAAMSPQTRTGAATPVTAWGGDIPGDLGEKVRNDATAFITGLADAHGRNEEWAGRSVREGAAIDAEEALETGVVEHVEPDLQSVLEAADGRRVEPKGITLQTADVALLRKQRNFEERFGLSPLFVAIPAIIVALIAVAAVLSVYKTSRWRVSTGREGMIGEVGTVRRRVYGPTGGMVFVHGELWRALPEYPDYAPLEPGTEVEVVGFRRTAVLVRPAKESGS